MAKTRYTTEMGNFHFQVIISGVAIDDIKLPAISISGINDGDTATFRHRESGESSTFLVPHAGLTTASNITIEGVNTYDLKDILALQDWRKQVTGEKARAFGSEYRNITVVPAYFDIDGNLNTLEDTIPVGIVPSLPFKKVVMKDCIATKLSVSNFDCNSPAISKWTLEVQGTRLSVDDSNLK